MSYSFVDKMMESIRTGELKSPVEQLVGMKLILGSGGDRRPTSSPCARNIPIRSESFRVESPPCSPTPRWQWRWPPP